PASPSRVVVQWAAMYMGCRLADTGRRHLQLQQQVFSEGCAVTLAFDRPRHAAQPGFAGGMVNRPAAVELRNAQRPETLGIVAWSAQPATEKHCELFPGQ